MPVKFKSVQQNDRALPSNVENVFRYFHAFAGIHDMLFDNAYSVTSTGWTNDSGLTTLPLPVVGHYDDLITTYDEDHQYA